MRVLELADDLRLAVEASKRLRVRDQVAGQHLDRHATAQPRMLGLEDQPHPPLVQDGEDPIGPPQSFADERVLLSSNSRRRSHFLTKAER